MFRQQFSVTRILRQAREARTRYQNDLVEAFEYIGDQQVEQNRDEGTYTDRTGNLRHSNYYVVEQNGTQISSGDDAVGSEDTRAIRSAIHNNRIQGANISLTIGAGMEYAAAVQALDNFVVLTTMSKSYFERELKDLLE